MPPLGPIGGRNVLVAARVFLACVRLVDRDEMEFVVVPCATIAFAGDGFPPLTTFAACLLTGVSQKDPGQANDRTNGRDATNETMTRTGHF
jgi:hypothetical protein